MPIFFLNRYFFQLFSYMSSKNISIKMSMNLLWTRASKEHESEIMTDRKTIQPTSIRFTGKVTTFPIITSLSTFQLSCWTQLSPVQRCSRCSCCAGTFSPRICTGCSLDIVFFFQRFWNIYFGLWSLSVPLGVSVCTCTMAGQTPELQQNWQS